MIKKESIKKTAICYWSNEDNAYIIESPLFPRTAGVGHTREAAQKHFEDMLDGIYSQLIKNKVIGYNKRGRPAKGGIQFHTQVRPKTKIYLAKLSKQLDISLGEVLDYLCTFHNVADQQKILSQESKISKTSIYPELVGTLSNLLSIMRQEEKAAPLLLREAKAQEYKTNSRSSKTPRKNVSGPKKSKAKMK